MNVFAILRKQAKAAINNELSHPAEVRKLFDWRYSVQCGPVTYMIGKTGENTCYYQGPDDTELVTCFPEQLIDQIDKWMGNQYVRHSIWRKSDDKIIGSGELEDLLTKMPKKFQEGLYIIGVKTNGQVVRKYKLKKGLNGMRYVHLKETENA